MESATSTTQRLLRDGELARVMNISKSLVHKRNRMGLLPMPIRIGRVLRWDANEIQAWIDAGLPSREQWIAIKEALRNA